MILAWISVSVHLVTSVRSASVILIHFLHQTVDFAFAFVAGSEFREPVTKEHVKSGFATAGFFPCFFDQSFIGAESDVFHYTNIVHTNCVCKGDFRLVEE